MPQSTAWAQAFGIGEPSSAVVIGRPLDFQAQLRVPAGESLSPACVSAEVTLGDRTLPAAALRVDFQPAGEGAVRVRVRTAQAVNEPIVSVQLHAGCENRVSRLFVLMADPAAEPVPQPVSGSSGSGATPAAAPSLPAPGAAASDRNARTPRAALTTTTAAARSSAAAAPVLRPPSVVSPPQPRLRLDPADLRAEPAPLMADDVLEQALEAVAVATRATRAAQEQAQAQAQRIAELERTVGGLRAQVAAADAARAEWQRRAAQAERGERWFVPLLLGLAALAALAGALAWQLHRLRQLRAAGRRWAPASTFGPAGPATAAGDTGPGTAPTLPAAADRAGTADGTARGPLPGRVAGVPAWPSPSVLDSLPPAEVTTTPGALPLAAPADAVADATTGGPAAEPFDVEAAARAMQRTEPLLQRRAAAGQAPRDVSIEELIDLEQQAEFFVVLGQDESAIDLLVDHLRHTGGGSPLPYLKLLEIYRRRGDREAYERTRTRFNHRFNAYAPAWDVDLTQGRSLEDYPGVMPRLQHVWARPLDAMAELEALLFRKSRGELFDLPAYRDVLFLYALARDLLDREAVDTGSVDLLLPLSAGMPAAGVAFSATAPGAWSGPDSDFGGDDHRPTAPVDLDLTLPESPRASIFDPLAPSRPRG